MAQRTTIAPPARTRLAVHRYLVCPVCCTPARHERIERGVSVGYAAQGKIKRMGGYRSIRWSSYELDSADRLLLIAAVAAAKMRLADAARDQGPAPRAATRTVRSR